MFKRMTMALLVISLGYILGCAKQSNSDQNPPPAQKPDIENVTDYSGCGATDPNLNPQEALAAKTWVQKIRNKYFTSTVKLRYQNNKLQVSATCATAYKFVTAVAVAPIQLTDKSYTILSDAEYSVSFERGQCSVHIGKAMQYYNIRGSCLELTDATGVTSITLVADTGNVSSLKVNDQPSPWLQYQIPDEP